MGIYCEYCKTTTGVDHYNSEGKHRVGGWGEVPSLLAWKEEFNRRVKEYIEKHVSGARVEKIISIHCSMVSVDTYGYSEFQVFIAWEGDEWVVTPGKRFAVLRGQDASDFWNFIMADRVGRDDMEE